MTAQLPPQIRIRTTGAHVEVEGLDQDDVEYALTLYQAVVHERVRARSMLAAHVNQALLDGELELISNASQQQVRRSAALRERLLREEQFETYTSLAGLRDSSEKAARTWVSRQRERHELFTVELHGRTLIPRVQLGPGGETDPRIAELLRPLLLAGLDGWSTWAWLTSPTDRLSGEIPAQVAAENIHRAHRAAARYAADVQLARDRSA